MEKDKKKTLTISSNLKKKIDTSSISTSGKKSFFAEKKNHLDKANHSIEATHLLPFQTLVKILRKKTLQGSLLNNRLQKTLLKKIINLQVKVNLNLKDQ